MRGQAADQQSECQCVCQHMYYGFYGFQRSVCPLSIAINVWELGDYRQISGEKIENRWCRFFQRGVFEKIAACCCYRGACVLKNIGGAIFSFGSFCREVCFVERCIFQRALQRNSRQWARHCNEIFFFSFLPPLLESSTWRRQKEGTFSTWLC